MHGDTIHGRCPVTYLISTYIAGYPGKYSRMIPSAKWEVHIMHFVLTYFAYFLHILAYMCNRGKLIGQMHIFAYFLHISAYCFAYFCIFVLMPVHILAYNAYQDIYLAYNAYFRNECLCIFSFAYFYISFAYTCI